MEEFGEAKLDWFRVRLGLSLSHGVPSHDTFARLFARLDPEAFAACFGRWTQALQEHTQGRIIALDVTTSRRSFVRQGGDYLFALKSNHAHPHEDVVSHFDWSLKQVTKGKDSATLFEGTVEERNYGHGRKETRRCWCLDAAAEEWEQARTQWVGLGSMVMVESERSVRLNTADGGAAWSEPTYERRYYLGSLAPNPDAHLAKRVLEAARKHWGIENSLHWVLDVVFNEDQSRIRKDNAPKNMAMLRHLTLNLLRLERTHRRGLKSKRLKAGWDDELHMRYSLKRTKITLDC
jgi:hypothetical protein